MTGFLDPLSLTPAGDDSPPDPGADDPTGGTSPVPEHAAGAELEQVRQLVLKAHPNVVPELITGDSVAALLASVAPAEAAYARLADRIGTTLPQVPAGTVAPAPVDPDQLPTAEKLRRGLAQLRRT